MQSAYIELKGIDGQVGSSAAQARRTQSRATAPKRPAKKAAAGAFWALAAAVGTTTGAVDATVVPGRVTALVVGTTTVEGA